MEIQDKVYIEQRDMLIKDLIDMGKLSDGCFVNVTIPFIDENHKRIWKETRIFENDRIDLINRYKL